MVKPDVTHNYYRDLELPTSASIDDIRKQYRKLALQYHPDRNGGREDECVPKFQAIQAANEVLGDPILKQKYDNDRQKAGLYGSSNFNPRSTTPRSQYQATSAYPPPPRRTQPPPTAQRPTSGGAPPTSAASGADRFANFSRPNSARKDPAQERANAFKAWQNWNAAGTHTQGGPQRPPNAPPPPQQQPPPPQPQANRRPPPPPPPRDPKMPPEDPARPGPKFKGPPPADPLNERASAWAAFGKPGMPPPKKPFPQNAPGPGRPPMDRPNVNVVPPRQNGPPPADSPTTPMSPRTTRPRPDPLQPFKSRAPPESIPFAEGNRVSTPYTKSFTGDQKDFFGDTLRRSHSVRDNTKLSPEDGSNRARARSSSPHRPKKDANSSKFEMPISSEESGSDADMTQTPEEADSSPTNDQQDRPGTAPNASAPFDRPKKVPTSRYNGARNEDRNRAQSDSEQQGRPRSSRSNMYANSSSSFSSSSSASFNSQAWQSHMFGAHSTSSARRESSSVPNWAIPSSLNPVLRHESRNTKKTDYVTAADERFISATENEQRAYLRFQAELRNNYDNVPTNLDMDVFLKLVSMADRLESSGDALLDEILVDILLNFDSVGTSEDNQANQSQNTSSFDHASRDDSYTSYGSRHRSEENINTTFSDGFNGEFVGEPDYVPPASGSRRKQSSPNRRPPNSRAPTSQPRSTTVDDYQTGPHIPVPQRPYGSDGTPNQSQRTTPMGSRDEQVPNSTWAWPPPPPPNPPNQANQNHHRNPSNRSNRVSSGSRDQPHIIVDDDAAEAGIATGRSTSGVAVDEPDAMDIDDTPPSHHTAPRSASNDHENEARPYFQPAPEWTHQHEKKQNRHRKSSSASHRRSQQRGAAANGGAKFNANLDDLRDSLAQSTQGGGGLDLSGINSSLPWQSQASTTMYGDPQLPRDLHVPPIPRPPPEPQRLSKASWQTYAAGFAEYIKAFHAYNATLLAHFGSREQQAQAQISSGMGWLEATGDTSGRLTAPTGFGEYMRGVKEDEKVRESWKLAWERHGDAIRGFEKVRDLLRKLVVGGSLVEN